MLTLVISYLRKSYVVLKPGPDGHITIDKQTALKWQTASELIYAVNGTFPYSNSGTDKDHEVLFTKQI